LWSLFPFDSLGLADFSQVPDGLQGEAAQVVSLYDSFLGAGPAATRRDVEASASRLVEQFQVANQRQGTRTNAVLGTAQPSLAVGPGLTDATGRRIARALELFVASYRESQGLEVPDWLQELLAEENK
jgi:hypothetical protein